jgi:precorrin-6B methylase 2
MHAAQRPRPTAEDPGEGYGEITCESLEKLLRHPHLDLRPNDSFVDIGSGIGKVCFHVLAAVGCYVTGIEYVKQRVQLARQGERMLRQVLPELNYDRLVFFESDAAKWHTLRNTHAYMFDAVFAPGNLPGIAALLQSRSPNLRRVVSTLTAEEWAAFGLQLRQLGDPVTVRMSGSGEQKTFRVFEPELASTEEEPEEEEEEPVPLPVPVETIDLTLDSDDEEAEERDPMNYRLTPTRERRSSEEANRRWGGPPVQARVPTRVRFELPTQVDLSAALPAAAPAAAPPLPPPPAAPAAWPLPHHDVNQVDLQKVEVRRTADRGNGLFARRAFRSGELVLTMREPTLMSVEEADRWFARHQHQFNAQTVFQGASLGDVSFRISKSQVIVDVAVLRGQQLWMYLNSPFPDPRKANVKVAVNYTQKNIK